MGYFRHPRTTQERRLSVDNWDGMVKIRCSRNFRNLPSNYDDIHRSERGRGWKNFRRDQYKVRDDKPKADSSRYAEHRARRDYDAHSRRYWWNDWGYNRPTKAQIRARREARQNEYPADAAYWNGRMAG